ncbi:MAG: DMT family transporter [Halocynthiibacter sp.]
MSHFTDNSKGAILMMLAMATFTLNDLCFKGLSGNVPLFEGLFIRGVMTTVMTLALAKYLGQLNFQMSKSDWIYTAWRAVAEIGSAYFYLTALFHMPIGNIVAIMQALPLTISLAGALFLREPIGWHRIVAIIVGFLGVMLIVRPGADGFNAYAIYGLGAVACVTIRDLVTRKLSPEAPSMTLTVTASVSVMVFGLFGLPTETWVMPSAMSWMLLFGAAIFIIGGYLFSIMVMRVGDIDFVAPFRYTALIFALVLGFVFYDEWPDFWTLVGSAIVVATGLYTLYREHHAR